MATQNTRSDKLSRRQAAAAAAKSDGNEAKRQKTSVSKSASVEDLFNGFMKLKPFSGAVASIAEDAAIKDFWINLDLYIDSRYSQLRNATFNHGARLTGVINPPAEPAGNFVDPDKPTPTESLKFSEEFRSYVAKKDKYLEQIPQLHSDLWNAMSEKSKELVKRGWTEYDLVYHSRDAGKLLKRMYDVHVNPEQNARPTAEAAKALFDVATLKSHASEPLESYSKRFDVALEKFEALPSVQRIFSVVDGGIRTTAKWRLNDAFKAELFIAGLDKSRYAEMLRHYDNEQARGVSIDNSTFPKTLDAAKQTAASFQSKFPALNAGNSSTTTTAFSTELKGNNNSNPGKNAKPGKGAQSKAAKEAAAKKRSEQIRKEDAAKEKDRSKSSKGPPECKLCLTMDPSKKGSGDASLLHYMDRCPHFNEAIASFTETVEDKRGSEIGHKSISSNSITFHAHSSKFGYPSSYGDIEQSESIARSNFVKLDCAADDHLFKDAALLTNLRTAEIDCSVTGIEAGTSGTKLELIGELRCMSEAARITAYHSPLVTANLLSLGKLEADGWNTQYIKDSGISPGHFLVTSPDVSVTFKFEKCISGSHSYYCDMSALVETKISACSEQLHLPKTQSVEANKKLFKKSEVARAEQARTLQKNIGFVSSKDLSRMLDNGEIRNTSLTSHDVRRAAKIFGPAIEILKGKTTKQKSKVTFSEPVELPSDIQRDQYYGYDGLYVNQQPFLHGLLDPLGLSLITDLKNNRSADSIYNAVCDQIETVEHAGFNVTKILSDPETGMVAAAELLRQDGYSVDVGAPGQHVPRPERRNRVLGERCRCITASLLWRMHPALTSALVTAACKSVNRSHSNVRVDHRSAAMLFTGQPLDAKKELKAAFGDYVQATQKDTDNSQDERTLGCIALYPDGNAQGSWTLFNLATKKQIHRTHFVVLPTPDHVIQYMNNWADSHKPDNKSSGPVQPGQISFSIDGDVPEQLEISLSDSDDDADDNVDPYPAALRAIPSAEDPLISSAQPVDPTKDPQSDHRGVVQDSSADNEGVAVDSNRRSARVAAQQQQQHKTSAHTGQMRKQMRRKELKVYNISVVKAIRSMPKAALRSIVKELHSVMIKKRVMQPIDHRKLTLKQAKKVIKSQMFLKEKYLSTGEFEKLKARLVARGDMEDREMYGDVSSPTASTIAVMIVALIASAEGRKVVSADIGTAYLNADIPEGTDLHVELEPFLASLVCAMKPEYKTFLKPNGVLVTKLNKALYGCIESAKLWYDTLSNKLISMGFERNTYEMCIFNRTTNGKQCTICIYVDDLLITCIDESIIDNVLDELTAEYGEMTTHRGAVHSYLGVTFDFSVDGEVKLTMDGYIESMLSRYSITKTAQTPATCDLLKVNPDSPLLSKIRKEEFHHRSAVLLYLAKRVRPEILLAVTFLVGRVQAPTEDDWHKLDRVFRYVNGAKYMGIRLSTNEGLVIHSYIDAAYGLHWDGKSHTGVATMLGQALIHTKSTKQKIVTKSSTESELVAATDGCSMAIYTMHFLEAQGYEVQPVQLHQDNQSTIQMVERGRSTQERTRHIHIRYFFLHDYVMRGKIVLRYTPTTEMVADILTKPLQGDTFRRLRQLLLNWYD